MKLVNLALCIFVTHTTLAGAAEMKLDAASAALVNKVVQTCVLSSGRIGTLNPRCSGNSELSLSLRKLAPTGADQDGDRYFGALETNGGAALGGLTLQVEVIVGAGMDADMNSVTFKNPQSDVVGVYELTNDEPQNGLAVLKLIRY